MSDEKEEAVSNKEERSGSRVRTISGGESLLSSPKVSIANPPSFIIQNADGIPFTDENEKSLFEGAEDAITATLVDIPPPPDGGWGWVIVFASFMCNLILDGIAYTFGVLLPPLVESFDSNRSTVSWVGSLLAGVYLMSGPIVGGLVNKFGCRPVCISGSIVACAGLVLSTLSPNVPILMLTYGVIGGLGLGLIYLPAVVMVGYYFESKRALATGISVCGSGVGTFLFAPLATQLLEAYGWKGANLIFAGLCLNCAVFGALMRPLELKAKEMPPPDTIPEEDEEEFEDDEHTGFQFQAESQPKAALIDNTKGVHEGSHSTIPDLNEDPGVLSNLNLTQIDMKIALPTITEASVTGAATQKPDQHPGISEIFPDQVVAGAAQEAEAQQHPQREELQRQISNPVPHHHQHHPHTGRRLSGRTRTTSGSEAHGGLSNRFQLTPVKKKLGPIPRNSSAPHFIDASKILPRNSSTPGFDKIKRQHSQISSTSGDQQHHASTSGHHPHFGQHLSFGLECGSSAQLSNTQLYLEPSSGGAGQHSLSRRGSRRNSRRDSAIVRPMYRKDVFYSGSVAHLLDINEIPTGLGQYRHSIISIPRRLSSLPRGSIVASHLSLQSRKASTIAEELFDDDGDKPILTAVKEMVNFELMINPIFLLVGTSNIFGMLGFYVPFVYLPNMAQLRGIAVEDANFLLSIIGISNTIGRVMAGWFSDFSWVDSLLVTNLAILFSGVSAFVLPFCSSYGAFVFVALMFGFFVAAYISLTSIVLVDLLGLDNLTSAFGLLVLYRGVSSMVGPPVAGAVYDATESYDISFYMAGGFLILASLISFVAQIWHRKRSGLGKSKKEMVPIGE